MEHRTSCSSEDIRELLLLGDNFLIETTICFIEICVTKKWNPLGKKLNPVLPPSSFFKVYFLKLNLYFVKWPLFYLPEKEQWQSRAGW